MSAKLTEEQRARIEANRQRALAKREHLEHLGRESRPQPAAQQRQLHEPGCSTEPDNEVNRPGGGHEVTVRAGAGLAVVLEGRGIIVREATDLTVDAILPGGSGAVFVSSSELSAMTGASARKKVEGGGGTSNWLGESARQAIKGSNACPLPSWQDTRVRIDALKKLPSGGVLMVQRGGKGQDDGGLLSALQIELCMHSPCIPVIFANDSNAFATMVELRVSGKCPASSAGGKGEPKKTVLAAGLTNKRLRKILCTLPRVDEPLAQQLLERFKTISGAVCGIQAMLLHMLSPGPTTPRRLAHHRLHARSFCLTACMSPSRYTQTHAHKHTHTHRHTHTTAIRHPGGGRGRTEEDCWHQTRAGESSVSAIPMPQGAQQVQHPIKGGTKEKMFRQRSSATTRMRV